MDSPPPSTLNRLADRQLDRRHFLAAAGGTTTLLLAGCSELLDFFGELVLEDVNVFNTTKQRVTGSITVTNPAEETVLDTTYDIPPEQDSESEDSATTYGGVFTAVGTYTVSVTLEEGPGTDAAITAERTVEVTDPSEQHIVVALGVEAGSGGVFVTVIDEFSDLEETKITDPRS